MPVVNGSIALNAVPGPCDWALLTYCVPDWDTFTPEQQVAGTALATFVLDAFTGHQFAQCPVTVRPCGDRCHRPSYVTYPVTAPALTGPGPWMTPYILNGLWMNCGCEGICDCRPVCRVDLGRPVAEVTEVKVNGLVLDPDAYELVGQWLARTDGGECWPSCQDPAVPDTEDHTFSVTYRPGRALPVAGQLAAGKLAGEFARGCGGGTCALPAQLSSLTRQGTQIELLDPVEVLAAGRTGIREVDLFIESVNPSGLRQPSRVFSPDLPRHPAVYG